MVLLVALLLLLLMVAAINWEQFSTPGQLNLVVRQVEVPLGAVMLGVVGLFTVLYLVFLAGARTTQLVETRRYAREAHEARQLANEAEASRFSELRQYLETEVQSLRDQISDTEERLSSAIDESHNSLVANLGEMDVREQGADAIGPGEIDDSASDQVDA
jgi:uncharacterized integral membrane protein